MAQYRAVVGIDYPPNKRAEAGDTISDLPEKSVAWLLDSGFIEPLDGKSKKTNPKVVDFNPDAEDGDKDGSLQDGTIHERPIESEDK